MINESYSHHQHIIDCYPNGIEGIDYVECKICTYVCGCISKHVKKIHGLNAQSYREKFGKTICENIHNKIKSNGDWIKRKKESGDDLTSYKKKLSSAVKNAINSNQSELNRRSRLLSSLNKRDDFREKASITAKKTSSRKDILEKRSQQLKIWRDNNPVEFQEKCIDKMHKHRTSRPEKYVLNFLQQHNPEFEFVGNQKIFDDKFTTKSHFRQVDIISWKNKIIVEIDGFLHFNNIVQWDILEVIKSKDEEFNQIVIENGYHLVRISYDQWLNNGELIDSAKEKLLQLIMQVPDFGLYCLGEKYSVSS